MTLADPALRQMVEPLRDAAIGEILEVMARELEREADVAPEPVLRDVDSNVVRSGALDLPSRGDLLVTREGRTVVRQIEGGPPAAEKSLIVQIGRGFEADLHPFRWDAAEVTVFCKQPDPNWTPLRRWFLEWFQSRYCDVAPDLLGAVHRIDGPREIHGGWAFTIDFGSAPPGCLVDLINAVAESGASRMRISQEQSAASTSHI